MNKLANELIGDILETYINKRIDIAISEFIDILVETIRKKKMDSGYEHELLNYLSRVIEEIRHDEKRYTPYY